MLVDGEKYACEACVRGHRVSSCQHADRPLQHINKKGRPVSQCPHCRGLRKSRATHAACECGTKGHKKEDHDDALETRSDPGTQPRCCCSHGQRCTCALKKDPLDGPVGMNPPAIPIPPGRSASNKKPRLAKAGSDTSIGAFSNRPSISHDGRGGQASGMPFKVPIPHSVPSKAPARRLTDSLPNLKRKMLHSPDVGSLGPQAKIRTTKSEHGSPGPRNTSQMPSLDFDFTVSQIPPFDFTPPFYTPQEEQTSLANFSVSPPTEWPTFDTHLEEYPTYHQSNHPYGGFDHQPLAATSSGEVSEISDYLSSRPQLSAANSDDSNIRRLSPAVYPSNSGASSALASDENLGGHMQLALQRAAQAKSANVSNESLASQLSHNSYQRASPINQHLDGLPRQESMEEVFLPPTSSPKVGSGPFSPTSAPSLNTSTIATNTSLRPPTSSPKELNFPDRFSPPGFATPGSHPQERSFHPTEVGTEFTHPASISQAQRYAQQNQAVQAHHNMAVAQATRAEMSPINQPPHMSMKPVELTPAEFGRAQPVAQTQQQQRPSMTRAPSSRSSVARSPVVGGTEDFRKQGFSAQDAHRLAHSRSSNLTQGLMSPGSYDRAPMSVHDLQQLAHPDSASEPSSGPSSAGHEVRSDPFQQSSGYSAQAAAAAAGTIQRQRLAYPATPTDALSGLTIPQTSSAATTPIYGTTLSAGGNFDEIGSQAKIFWAGGGGGGGADTGATASSAPSRFTGHTFVTQQDIEGASAYWGRSG